VSGFGRAHRVTAQPMGVEDLDDVRECLGRLAFAFTGLLGNRPAQVVTAARLRELAGIAREIGDLCDQRAAGSLVTEWEGMA